VLSRETDRTWLACGSRARLGLWTLDAACVRLRDLGVEFEGPVVHPGGDRSLYCEDPVGNVLELWDFFQRGKRVDALNAVASSAG
jgi:hypothetical protein